MAATAATAATMVTPDITVIYGTVVTTAATFTAMPASITDRMPVSVFTGPMPSSAFSGRTGPGALEPNL